MFPICCKSKTRIRARIISFPPPPSPPGGRLQLVDKDTYIRVENAGRNPLSGSPLFFATSASAQGQTAGWPTG